MQPIKYSNPNGGRQTKRFLLGVSPTYRRLASRYAEIGTAQECAKLIADLKVTLRRQTRIDHKKEVLGLLQSAMRLNADLTRSEFWQKRN